MGTGLGIKGDIGKGGASGDGVSTTPRISADLDPTGDIGKVRAWLDNIDSDVPKAGSLR